MSDDMQVFGAGDSPIIGRRRSLWPWVFLMILVLATVAWLVRDAPSADRGANDFERAFYRVVDQRTGPNITLSKEEGCAIALLYELGIRDLDQVTRAQSLAVARVCVLGVK